jgi:hypothetical protein
MSRWKIPAAVVEPAGGDMNGFAVGSDGVAQDYDDWADTEFGPQFHAKAWSGGKQPPEPVHYRSHHPWRKALAWAGSAIGLAAMTALLVGIGGSLMAKGDDHNAWPTGYSNPPREGPASSAPTDVPPPPAGPFVPNMNVVAHQTQDGDFLQRVLAANWQYDNPSAAVADAHNWCRVMREYGVSPAYVAQVLYTQDAGQPGYPDYAVTVAEVNAAVAVYCPDRG